MAGDRSR